MGKQVSARMIMYLGANEEGADFEYFEIRATHCEMWRNFLVSIKAVGSRVEDAMHSYVAPF